MSQAAKNYITPAGLQRLRDELKFLLTRERPAVTQVVAWAAGNGDRSENADYQYRQAPSPADRSADSLSPKAHRCRGSGGPGNSPEWPRGVTRLLRGHGALRERSRNRARREYRRRRRSRSRPQSHQLDLATGAGVDEVRTRGLGRSSRAGDHGGARDPRGAVRPHPRRTVHRATRSGVRAEGSPFASSSTNAVSVLRRE